MLLPPLPRLQYSLNYRRLKEAEQKVARTAVAVHKLRIRHLRRYVVAVGGKDCSLDGSEIAGTGALKRRQTAVRSHCHKVAQFFGVFCGILRGRTKLSSARQPHGRSRRGFPPLPHKSIFSAATVCPLHILQSLLDFVLHTHSAGYRSNNSSIVSTSFLHIIIHLLPQALSRQLVRHSCRCRRRVGRFFTSHAP